MNDNVLYHSQFLLESHTLYYSLHAVAGSHRRPPEQAARALITQVPPVISAQSDRSA